MNRRTSSVTRAGKIEIGKTVTKKAESKKALMGEVNIAKIVVRGVVQPEPLYPALFPDGRDGADEDKRPKPKPRPKPDKIAPPRFRSR